MQWLPGHRLKNRPYEIVRELGQGGFGVTYKAKNLSLDVPIVIKTPNSRLQKDINYSKYVENFKKEARRLAKLGMNPHPHIVRVFDFFQEDNLPCIVMDFVPGESLYNLVQMQGALSETQALQYIRQIGSALVVCHQAGIIHRDVHPNNILIHAKNGNAVLIDFGIAGNTQTSRNTHSGNRAFAPWEQMAYWEQQSSKTPQVDIYTLAAGFYYLVTGEVPTECLGRKYNNDELIEPQELCPSLSEGINKAILKGMEIYPENRPGSIQEWLKLLVIPQAEPEKPKQKPQPKPPQTYVPESYQPRSVTYPVSSTPPRTERYTQVTENSNSGVTRRNWLKYSGLAISTVVVTSIGKSIWDNVSQPTGEIDSPEESDSISSINSKSESTSPETANTNLSEDEFDVITVNDRGEEIDREKGRAKYFTEDLGNDITLDMVEIPSGTFLMGTEEEEIERLVKKYNSYGFRNESPQHQVTVPSFYMAKYPVTQEQWKAVAQLPQIERELELDPSRFKGDNLPVERVSWNDAVEFGERLSKHTGKEYRLPSEAEWEYACRAGTTTPFHFGETITTDLANYRGIYTYANEPKGKYRERTTPVGSFPPDAFGLYDMHGLVWELCADTWHENYQGAPNDGSARVSGSGITFVVRGGSWSYNPLYCRSAIRLGTARDNRGIGIGFRVVCVAPRAT